MTENSSSEIMIETQGLSKYYGEFIAVEDLSFSIKEGEVVAFLGPNGAGKSTTMKMLTGYLAPPLAVLEFVEWKLRVIVTQWPTESVISPKMVHYMRK